jgi:hypothetical protein
MTHAKTMRVMNQKAKEPHSTPNGLAKEPPPLKTLRTRTTTKQKTSRRTLTQGVCRSASRIACSSALAAFCASPPPASYSSGERSSVFSSSASAACSCFDSSCSCFDSGRLCAVVGTRGSVSQSVSQTVSQCGSRWKGRGRRGKRAS